MANTPDNADPWRHQTDTQSVSQNDCSKCKTRRIKCDRALLGCQKCSKKGYRCPGYGPRVQWVNDAATRGRMRGLQATVLENHARSQPKVFKGLGPFNFVNDDGQNHAIDIQDLARQHYEDITTYDLSQSLWDKLRRYYIDNVTRLMVWADTQKNLYRDRIIEIASNRPVLRLAISAMAALHYNATGHNGKLPLPESFRDEAVRGIATSVKDILENTKLLTLENAQWILSSMMVLSCCEMIEAGAGAADWHRRAARRLVGVIKTMDWCHDQMISFLINQLAIYDILSCTTSFDLSNIQEVILPVTEEEDVLFSKLLLLIHDVTLYRGRYDRSEIEGDDQEYLDSRRKDLSTLRANIELARGETLMVAGTLGIQDALDRRDFIRLVDLHCKATLLFAHRVMYRDESNCGRQLLEDIFLVLASIEKPERICHNLPWPLFMAGTECHGDPEKQRYIISHFKRVYDITGLIHYLELVEFLTSFWAGEEQDWQVGASQREAMGLRILAI
ncbi:fungal transcriptional regulatory [Fusarium heterosporum]|uniref:Fungal transcriptional regulatory n=1 Tax=Fusarium heterosporum TaxID=42747 RepID=A0A8H5SX24_FUSHE|nr:fungal transcriptional regulatory [Fusarium heterosporum]